MTALIFHIENKKRMQLSAKKQSETVIFMMMVFMLQLIIILGQMLEVMDVGGDDKPNSLDDHVFTHTVVPAKAFYIYIVRFAGALALQLMMVPQINKGLGMIHYVNNHPESFGDGEFIACMAGLCQVSICLLAIGLNCYLIVTYQYVLNILKHFLSLKVVIAIPNLLVGAMTDNTIAEVFKVPVPITNHPSQM